MPIHHRLSALLIAALVTAGLALRPAPAQVVAAPAVLTLTVNSTVDDVDLNPGNGQCATLSGACTLRAAVMEADAASGAGATIIVPAGIYSLTISAAGLDSAQNGDLNFTTPGSGNPIIRLSGAGPASTIIDANQLDRVLTNHANRTTLISGLTLRGGYMFHNNGGGLRNLGTLTVTNSAITANQAVNGGVDGGSGGGIYNEYNASLALIDSTLSGNTTDVSGGGLYNNQNAQLLNSTVSGNSAANGGGIFNSGSNEGQASLILINSTLSGNNADVNGGALANAGYANIYNTTLVLNGADGNQSHSGSAGGVYALGTFGYTQLRNTLLAGNYLDNSPIYDDCSGTLKLYGNNLFGESAPCTLLQQDGGSHGALNSLLLLGPLQNNGGPTPTVALLGGSNAIDGGDSIGGCVDAGSAPIPTDQRGIPRVVGARCDIGAFEFLPPAAYLPLMRR